MSSSSSKDPPAARGFFRDHAGAIKFTVLAAACIMAYGLGEAFAINAYANLMPLHPGVRTVDKWLGQNREAPQIVRPRPLQLFENIPDFAPKGERVHNKLGYRQEEDFPIEKPPGQVRIVALGASTTYGYMYVEKSSDTWIHQLDEMLSEKFPDRDIFGINAGLNGATSAELLSAYIFQHQYLDIDILILHVGGNDRFPMFYPDYNPQYTHFLKLAKRTEPRKGELALLGRSGMARLFYAWWLADRGFGFEHGVAREAPMDPDTVLQRVRSTEPVGFRRNLNTLITLAKANGTKVVLFPFVQRSKDLANGLPKQYVGMEQAFVEGLAKTTKVMADLAAEHDVHYVEAGADRFEPDWFQDNCHLNAQGHRAKAKVLFEYFLAQHLLGE